MLHINCSLSTQGCCHARAGGVSSACTMQLASSWAAGMGGGESATKMAKKGCVLRVKTQWSLPALNKQERRSVRFRGRQGRRVPKGRYSQGQGLQAPAALLAAGLGKLAAGADARQPGAASCSIGRYSRSPRGCTSTCRLPACAITLPPQDTIASRLRPVSWLPTGRRGAASISPPRSNTAAAPMPASRGTAGVGGVKEAPWCIVG